MGKKISLIFLAALLLALPVCGACAKPTPTPEKPVELSYNSEFPVLFGQQVRASEWAKEIEMRTEGRVKITMYPAQTLTASGEIYESVVTGIADIGESLPARTPGRFPLIEVLEMPGYPFNGLVTCLVANDWYEKFEPEEFADTHVLFVHVHPPGGIMTKDKPIRSLEDLKGLRIRSTGLSAKIVEALGAVPVAIPAPDTYDALLKGVVDGTMGVPNQLLEFKWGEVTKYTTLAPEVGYNTIFAIVMNLDKWNALPADIQKVFTEVSKEYGKRSGERWNEQAIAGYNFAQERGHVFITLSPDEIERWVRVAMPLLDDYVKAVEAKGLPGKEALEYRQQLIEKYSKMYPPIKFE